MPSNPEDLLQDPRYWDRTLLLLFLEHVDETIYSNAKEGLRLARVAPRLAQKTPKARGAEGRRRHQEHLVRAHATLGGAYRATHRLRAAESEYVKALQITESSAISPQARANLYRRLAILRVSQKRHDEALALAEEAVEMLRDREDQQELAAALAALGYVLNEQGRFSTAIPHHGEALRIAGTALRLAGRRRPVALVRIHQVARVNLANALAHSPSPEIAATALAHVQFARRELRGKKRSRARHHCQWIEGKAWLAMGLDRRAEQAFWVARRGFVRLDAPWEIALVSLDIAGIHRLYGQWHELEALAEDTFRRFRELSGDFESISALGLWLEAAQAREGARVAMSDAQQTLQARMPPS